MQIKASVKRFLFIHCVYPFALLVRLCNLCSIIAHVMQSENCKQIKQTSE